MTFKKLLLKEQYFIIFKVNLMVETNCGNTMMFHNLCISDEIATLQPSYIVNKT